MKLKRSFIVVALSSLTILFPLLAVFALLVCFKTLNLHFKKIWERWQLFHMIKMRSMHGSG